LQGQASALGQALKLVLETLRQTAQPGQRAALQRLGIDAAVARRAGLDIGVDVARQSRTQRVTQRQAYLAGCAFELMDAAVGGVNGGRKFRRFLPQTPLTPKEFGNVKHYCAHRLSLSTSETQHQN